MLESIGGLDRWLRKKGGIARHTYSNASQYVPQLGLNDFTLPENAGLKFWHSDDAKSVEIVFEPVSVPASVESDTLGCSACVVPDETNRRSIWSKERPINSFMMVGDHEAVVYLNVKLEPPLGYVLLKIYIENGERLIMCGKLDV